MKTNTPRQGLVGMDKPLYGKNNFFLTAERRLCYNLPQSRPAPRAPRPAPRAPLSQGAYGVIENEIMLCLLHFSAYDSISSECLQDIFLACRFHVIFNYFILRGKYANGALRIHGYGSGDKTDDKKQLPTPLQKNRRFHISAAKAKSPV